MPGMVRLAVTRVLALLSTTRSLSITYARIGLVPPPALRTRTLFPHSTGDRRRPLRARAIMPPGSFLPSRPGSFFASVAASGDPTPSEYDYVLTKDLLDAGELLGVRVIDHLVIAGSSYRSIYDECAKKGAPCGAEELNRAAGGAS